MTDCAALVRRDELEKKLEEWKKRLATIISIIEQCPLDGRFYAPMYSDLLSMGREIYDFREKER